MKKIEILKNMFLIHVSDYSVFGDFLRQHLNMDCLACYFKNVECL